jgi:hypothetical protein
MIRSKRLKVIAIMILIIGQGIAIFLYLTAESMSPDLFNPLTSKRFIRELELYGGKFNVLAAELSQWCAEIWHGKSLAVTVGILSLALAILLWFVSTSPQISHETITQDSTGHNKI